MESFPKKRIVAAIAACGGTLEIVVQPHPVFCCILAGLQAEIQFDPSGGVSWILVGSQTPMRSSGF
jgi:hypothetical protein